MAKTFQFRLERLLDLRRVQEDLRKREFAEANRAVLDHQQTLVKLLVEEDSAKNELRKRKQSLLDLTALRLQEQYANALSRKIVQGYRDLQGLQMKVVEKRREWADASKGVQVLERFRDRKREEHRLACDREEQKFLDEVAQERSR